MEIEIISDGLTWVEISNHHQPTRFNTNTVKILPGNYTVIGRRTGFRDVEFPVQLRNGMGPVSLTVVCTVLSQ